MKNKATQPMHLPHLTHIVHVIRDLDQQSGGPSRTIPSLAERVARHSNSRQTILYGAWTGTEIEQASYPSVQFVRIDADTSLVRTMTRLRQQTPQYRMAVHSHGLWAPLNHRAIAYARRNRIPYIVSPRGMISPWCMQQKMLKKKAAWWLYQRQDFHHMACAHVTAEHEAHDVRTNGWHGPIAVIPNGCELSNIHSSENLQTRDEHHHAPHAPHALPRKRITFMSRIHPVKGLPLLVKAWHQIRPRGWTCTIAGPDSTGHLAEIRQLVAERGLTGDFEFLPPVSGSEKQRLLAKSSATVLPSHSENFGMVVAESLAAGTPVITTQGTPWRDLNDHNCGWWIARNVESLANTIQHVTNLPASRLSEMGQNGVRLIRKKYAWPSVAESMLYFYKWVLCDAEQPHFISPATQPLGRYRHAPPSAVPFPVPQPLLRKVIRHEHPWH